MTAAARTTASGRTPTLVARFSELRAASRALEHLLGAGSEESHRLADALVELSDLARTCGADPGDQRELHAQLDAAEASVRACLERVTLEEVAPRAAAFAPGAEGDALALLEVLLGDVGGPDECRAAVECLVTRLATEVRGGRRLVARDPSTLTPRLAERLRSDAGGRDDPDGLDPGEAEALLLEAAARLDGEATEAVEAEVAALRTRLGRAFWSPIVMRALVFYGARAWRRWDGRAAKDASATRDPGAERSPHATLGAPGDATGARRDGPPPSAGPDPEAAEPSAAAAPAAPAVTPGPAALAREPASPTGPLEAWPELSRSAEAPRPAHAPATLAAPGTKRPPSAASPAPAPTSPPGPAARRSATGELADWEIPDPPPRPRPAPVRVESRRGPGLRAWALAALAAAVAWSGLGGPDGDVKVLGRPELTAISPWLEGGYRSEAGRGDLFVGTLAAPWQGLDPEEREESGRDLARRLGAAGVTQIEVYDQERRLRVQVAQGLPPRFGG